MLEDISMSLLNLFVVIFQHETLLVDVGVGDAAGHPGCRSRI